VTSSTAASPALKLPEQRVTQLRVIRSEWTKLRSLRSTVISLLVAVVFILGLSALVPAVVVHHWPPKDPNDLANFDPTGVSLAGIFLAQLAIGVLGVLIVTGEYATGMIRATMCAVPRRLPALWAKLIVFGTVTLLLTIPAALAAFSIGQSILTQKHIQTSLSQPHVTRAVIGAALYVTVVGVLGLALGALIRNTAGGIASLFGLLFVLPVVVHFLPSSWADPINKYLPMSAGQALVQVRPDSGSLSPWTGFLVFCLYAVVALVLAAIALRRRDV
jgi:ABC-type transport system involved in multi-copper enzyme maturation permease subunit